MSKRKDLILGVVEDLVANFLYYDRKDDEDLPRGKIEKAIKNKEITIEEMVSKFNAELIKGIK